MVRIGGVKAENRIFDHKAFMLLMLRRARDAVREFLATRHGSCSYGYVGTTSLCSGAGFFFNLAHSSPRCEGLFPPTTRTILHQPHSKPTLPGSAFFCAHFLPCDRWAFRPTATHSYRFVKS